MMKRAIFLDRDNTIIHNDGDLGDPTKVEMIKGSALAIASLRGLGFRIIVVSNQGGVARGVFTEADVDRVNQRINELIHTTTNARIDRFYYCPYHPEGKVDRYRSDHPWRKPNPGMLLQAAADFEIDLAQSWTIGDQMRDVEAGRAAGTRTILLRPDADEVPHSDDEGESAAEDEASGQKKRGPDHVARNLTEAVRLIAQARRPIERAEPTPPVPSSPRPKPRSPEQRTAMKTSTRPFRPWATQPVEVESSSDEVSQSAAPPRQPDVPDVATRPGSSAIDKGGDRAEAEQAGHRAVSESRQATDVQADVPAKATAESSETVHEAKPIVGEESDRADDAHERVPEAPPRKVRRPTSSPRPVQKEMPPAGRHDEESSGSTDPDVDSEPSDGDAMPESQAPASTAAPAPSSPIGSRLGRARSKRRGAPDSIPAEQTLREILAELRNQRSDAFEFSYNEIAAIALQLLAVLCLLAALLFGRGGEDIMFARWIAVAVLFQLSVIATLLFRRT